MANGVDSSGPMRPRPGTGSRYGQSTGTVQKGGTKTNLSFDEARLGDRVVERLLQRSVVTEAQVRKAYEAWQEDPGTGSRPPLWRMLTMTPEVDRDLIFAEAARVYAFEEMDIDQEHVVAFLDRRREAFDEGEWDRMIALGLLPAGTDRDPLSGEPRWTFVTHDPARPEVHQALEQLKVPRFAIFYARERTIRAVINTAFQKRNEYLERLNEAPPIFDYGTEYETKTELIDEDALEAEIKRSSLINLFEAALVEAVKRGASDLHIFPNSEGHIELHMRIDGELVRWHKEERVRAESFLAVVKDNSYNVDRFEREKAQDGFIQRFIDGVIIRFRVSVLPLASQRHEIYSESIVIRVLDDRKVLTDLRKLGLLDVALKRFDNAIRQPHGMVILTGPTGSGKSTTLVAALHQVITPKVNVLTVEDPVEYIIRGVRQIKLNHKLNLEGALRAILRHDPDIVMVGEMRDRETAELAVKLANTGHITFSTLHTNDAPSAVARLYKMGVEPFLIAYAINLVVAQRLIRKLCPACKRVDPTPDMELLKHLGFSEDAGRTRPVHTHGSNPNCKTCRGIGYIGRRAIAEAMEFTPAIRRLIMAADDMIDEDALRQKAVEEGMLTLQDSAREFVLSGETSIDEMLRVTGT